MSRAATAASNMGVHVGIYSSIGEWGQTVGNSCTKMKDYPLWYAHYDNNPSFSDSWAYQFGGNKGKGIYNYVGWTKPAMKQFNDNGPCVNVDVNWYPN